MPYIRDISLYFRPKCCIKEESSIERSEMPCQNSPPPRGPYDYFRKMFNKGVCLHATTITIGNKRYGRMSDKEQYQEFKKAIRQHIKFHSNSRYIYEFEHTKQGQLHAHGIEYNVYQNRFSESFHKFGARNGHKDSFQKIKAIDEYIKYITKDKEFPTLTNVGKKDIREVFQCPLEDSTTEAKDTFARQPKESSESQGTPHNTKSINCHHLIAALDFE